jgi:hypothetical protein
MIDPVNITNFNLNKYQLEEMLLFWVCAAGKNALSSARGLDRFLTFIDGHKRPFESIWSICDRFGFSKLPVYMKEAGIGCYNQKATTFWQLADGELNLKTCSIAELEQIKGIGRKTSRCFVMHSRKNVRCAGLDTHILHFLADQGYEVPKATPSSQKEYLRLENAFLKLADKSGMSLADYDLHIWKLYSGRNNG